MDGVLTILANLIYQYGGIVAGNPSGHGSYEAPVPAKLTEKK